ncbi:MAG: VWA domain-containing protein [Gammaproteobacteria bacterium]|nr:VWA domain-containing protein [Gammaproteobacteria bacterium]
MKQRRRDVEVFGLSFLDVISCGFGAIILLLIITKTVEPVVLEATSVNLEGLVAERKDAVFEIRGQITVLTLQLEQEQIDLTRELAMLARLKRDLSMILGEFSTTQEEATEQVDMKSRLTTAKQALTEEMERLLGMNFTRRNNTIGGITVDSEYIIFVIDTSGSMFNYAWSAAMRKVQEVLEIYPRVKGIQVMNDMGDYMFSNYRGEWIPDSPVWRRAIVERMRSWNPFSNSSPVEGIQAAIAAFYDPDKRISIYVFGDDFSGTSIEQVVDTIDRINVADEDGMRRVRIHAVGFPVIFQAAPGRQASAYRFAALMRELTYRNNGTFVALPEFR